MLQFKKFSQDNLIHGVFDKGFGNISFKCGRGNKVIKNRERIFQALGIKKKNVYEMDQVHASNISVLDKKTLQLLKGNVVNASDGLITQEKSVFLMIKTADCFPILFYDPVKKVIAAVHAGWRGVIGKIFLETILKMTTEFNCQNKDILVAIGPAIRSCCFQHNNLVQEKLPEWSGFISGSKNKKVCDLAAFIKKKLIKYGVKKDNIEDCAVCTACNLNYFSHFRSLRNREKEGRFATIIGMKD